MDSVGLKKARGKVTDIRDKKRNGNANQTTQKRKYFKPAPSEREAGIALARSVMAHDDP